jgi:polysaccharide export outer membrane protein
VLARAGVDVSKFHGEMVPTVFHANMRDPTIFFAAQKFRMRDKDVIYVSNADTIELVKFLNIVNGVSDTAANVPANAVDTRKSVRQLTN